MTEIRARNVNDALVQGLEYLGTAGVTETSRYGDVIVAPEPVCTIYRLPHENVLLSARRNANPFFHLLGDALWCLAGRQDIRWPVYFNQRFIEFSDDGLVHPGGYGYRWLHWFGRDQLLMVVDELRKNPNSRRAVLQMWHPKDFERLLSPEGTKDAPCNLCVMFDCRGEQLNMTVVCRSNDIWWGCYGANAVQFSVLQEYLAACLDVPIGEYRQFSNNFHIYTNVVPPHALLSTAAHLRSELAIRPYPDDCIPMLCAGQERQFVQELDAFMKDPLGSVYTLPFFLEVAVPMYAAWQIRKLGTGTGLMMAQQIADGAWRAACVEWIERAEIRKAAKEGA